MSNDSAIPPSDTGRNRRGSVTSAALSNLFQRSNSTSAGSGVTASATAAAAMEQRRRLSVTTLGLSGTGPASASLPFAGLRRGSISTNNSDSIDEHAVDDEDAARTAPNTPFTRRMSFGAQAMRSIRAPGSSSPGSTDQGFNWSEQLRSRAESTVASGQRPSFSFASGMTGSPPRTGAVAPPSTHDRNRSVSEMPAPPAQTPKPRSPPRDTRPKPDAFQERILKGDFYMD